MILSLCAAGVLAAPLPLIERVGEAHLDWTAMEVRVEVEGRIAGVDATQRIVEQDLRARIGPQMIDGAAAVQVTSEQRTSDLIEADARLKQQLGYSLAFWEVVRARYGESGRVELVGAIPMVELLKPWALEVANPRPADAWIATFDHSGVLVDARGLSGRPAFAPRLLAPDGQALFDGSLWQDVATTVTPVVYVSDPVHPASARVGESPWIVRAVEARGSDLVLGEEDARYFREHKLRDLLRRGQLVVVLDAP